MATASSGGSEEAPGKKEAESRRRADLAGLVVFLAADGILQSFFEHWLCKGEMRFIRSSYQKDSRSLCFGNVRACIW